MSKKVVIYTRYSSDMQREESCEDQEREIRRGLARLQLDARDAVVLNDHAESGTKASRSGYDRLKAMILRSEVGLLAVDDQSRLSRADNAFGFIQDLVFQGGRFVSTGENIDTDQEGWELRVKVMELHNSTTIRELGRRVHRGQKGRVLDDGAAGDHPFGYESYHLEPGADLASRRGPKPKKGLRIFEAEARWVRQVFAWFVVERWSIAEIARELTRLGVDKGTKARKPGWHHSQVRRMIGNQKYVGRWAWGVSRTVRNSQGKVKKVDQPEDQWVVRDRPDLRIVDQATWDGAVVRLAELGETYNLKPGQKPRGARPHHTEVYPKSLLGGLVHCHGCGSRLWIRGSESRYLYLGCPNHPRGTCSMGSQVSVERAEKVLLEYLSGVLTSWPGWLADAAEAMRAQVARQAGELPESIREDEARLAGLRPKIDNLVDLLANGRAESEALLGRLAELELEAKWVATRIEEGRSRLRAAVAMPGDEWIRSRLAELTTLLGSDPRGAAPLLRRLLGRVTAESVVAPGKVRGYVRLNLPLDPAGTLKEALGGHLPESVLDLASTPAAGVPGVIQLDLGGPSRYDALAPRIAELRAEGHTWERIGRETGLGTSNAHKVGKRWDAAQATRPAAP